MARHCLIKYTLWRKRNKALLILVEINPLRGRNSNYSASRATLQPIVDYFPIVLFLTHYTFTAFSAPLKQNKAALLHRQPP